MPSNEHIPWHVGVFLVTLLCLSVHTLDPPTCDHTVYGGMSTPENMDRPFKISVSDNEYGVNNNELYCKCYDSAACKLFYTLFPLQM